MSVPKQLKLKLTKRKMTDEQRQRMSAAQKLRWSSMTPEDRQRFSDRMTLARRLWSADPERRAQWVEKCRARNSASGLARWVGTTPEQRRDATAYLRTPELKAKRAAAARASAQRLTPEQRRVRCAHLHTPASRLKAAAARKASWAFLTPEQRASRVAGFVNGGYWSASLHLTDAADLDRRCRELLLTSDSTVNCRRGLLPRWRLKLLTLRGHELSVARAFLRWSAKRNHRMKQVHDALLAEGILRYISQSHSETVSRAWTDERRARAKEEMSERMHDAWSKRQREQAAARASGA